MLRTPISSHRQRGGEAGDVAPGPGGHSAAIVVSGEVARSKMAK